MNPENGAKRILFISYPLLPVTEQSSGGAEQALWCVEHELHAREFHTTVAGCYGCRVSGTVFVTGASGNGSLDSAQWHEAAHTRAVLELNSIREAIGRGFHLLHDMSGSFFRSAARTETPVLATLHLPRSFYPPNSFQNTPPNLFFNCVSHSQAKSFREVPNLLGVVKNGIRLERFRYQEKKRDSLLWIGRVCLEKGAHLALDVAEKTGLPIVLAGKVFPFSYHRLYFDQEIAPRLRKLGDQVKFVESPSIEHKVKLIQSARALLVPSLVDETSSLVSMEAAACGTPVIAYRRGALPEVVQDGVTGLFASTVDEMAAAVQDVSRIKTSDCRQYAEENFSSEQMAEGYLDLYRKLWKKQEHSEAAQELAAA